ncbi:MAG: hypothetical protein ACKPKO_03315, partial [Candidatus Fonsibacter sp.]
RPRRHAWLYAFAPVQKNVAEYIGDIGAKRIEAIANRGFAMGHQYVSTTPLLPNGILPPVGDTSGRLDSKRWEGRSTSDSPQWCVGLHDPEMRLSASSGAVDGRWLSEGTQRGLGQDNGLAPERRQRRAFNMA